MKYLWNTSTTEPSEGDFQETFTNGNGATTGWGGGGSYNVGLDQSSTACYSSVHGKVIITIVP